METSSVFVLFILALSLSISKGTQKCGPGCCFYWPPKCSPPYTCKVIVRYMYMKKENELAVEIRGKVDGWVAFGLNNEKGVMGGVKGEICYLSKNTVKLKRFRNEGTDFDFTETVPMKSGGILANINGTLVCGYRRPLSGKHVYDLRKPFYLISSWGKMEGGEEEPEEHPTGGYFWSKAKVDLLDTKCPQMESIGWNLVALHGILMVIAWVGLAAVGMVFARYTKKLFGERTCLSLKVWFQGHRALMFSTVILTIAGIVVIFVEAGAWRTEMGAHPYTGILVTIFALLQPIAAFFRPGPGAEKRWLFNWSHRLFGLLTFILAMVTVALGAAYVEVTAAVLIVYVVLILLAVLLLEFRQRCKGRTLVIQANDSEELYAEEDFESMKTDALFRKVALVSVMVLGGIFTVTFIGLFIYKAHSFTHPA